MSRSPLSRLAILALVALAACAAPPRVVSLKNTETGEIAECREESWADQTLAKQERDCVAAYVISCRVERGGHVDRKRKLDACVSGYVRQGFVILPELQTDEK